MFFSSLKVKHGEKIITSESDVTGGALKVNDAFDLFLVELPAGNYELRLFMKLQFFFIDDPMSKWTKSEEQRFISNWKSRVGKIWDGQLLKVLPSKKTVRLGLDFEIQIGGFMFDHWEISVKKVPAGSTFRCFVNPGKKNVMLTENDNAITIRNVRKVGNFQQITSAHEFGHMIGLDDEYGPLFGGISGAYTKDYASVMNIGSKVRSRHLGQLNYWLDKAIKANGIK